MWGVLFCLLVEQLAGSDLERLGAIDFKAYESTPLLFHGRTLLMETITLTYPRHISHWNPAFANCSSYFRVRDLEIGVVLRNLTESCDHSFGSAFVDTLTNGTQVLWIFGTAWYRPIATGKFASEQGWSGACSSDADCTVDAYRTVDASLQHWDSGTLIKPGRSTWNVGVSLGRPSKHGRKYILAAEQQPLPGTPLGSSWTTFFYELESDGDLFSSWSLLPTEQHVIGGPGTHGACPTIRYCPEDDYYYVISGGLSVYLDRSKDLSSWEPARDGGVVLQADPSEAKPCEEYIGYQPDSHESELLRDAKNWDIYSSDVDLVELGTSPPTTLFVYMLGNQGNTIFSGLLRYNATALTWFQSHFQNTTLSV